MKSLSLDFIVIGAGVTGLCLAARLKDRYKNASIAVVDKEAGIALHTSSRNSGVIHAGLYYKPDTLKARVCVKGGIRLKDWCTKNRIPLLNCGKLVVPKSSEEEATLDILHSNASANGAVTEFVDRQQIQKLSPFVNSSIRTALWSPNTSVVDPKSVIRSLEDYLYENNIEIILNSTVSDVLDSNTIILRSSDSETLRIQYQHLFNCSGAYACDLADKFKLNHSYRCVPFKGIYWQYKIDSNLKSPNVYPVPDLNMPFLGVHLTPSPVRSDIMYIGPTATLALGRENYNLLQNIEIKDAAINAFFMLNQYLTNSNRIRAYVNQQLFQFLKPLMLRELNGICSPIDSSLITPSNKVGIRPQLINIKDGSLVNDFLLVRSDPHNVHILNSISPAFTSFFELSDYIIDRSLG